MSKFNVRIISDFSSKESGFIMSTRSLPAVLG